MLWILANSLWPLYVLYTYFMAKDALDYYFNDDGRVVFRRRGAPTQITTNPPNVVWRTHKYQRIYTAAHVLLAWTWHAGIAGIAIADKEHTWSEWFNRLYGHASMMVLQLYIHPLNCCFSCCVDPAPTSTPSPTPDPANKPPPSKDPEDPEDPETAQLRP